MSNTKYNIEKLRALFCESSVQYNFKLTAVWSLCGNGEWIPNEKNVIELLSEINSHEDMNADSMITIASSLSYVVQTKLNEKDVRCDRVFINRDLYPARTFDDITPISGLSIPGVGALEGIDAFLFLYVADDPTDRSVVFQVMDTESIITGNHRKSSKIPFLSKIRAFFYEHFKDDDHLDKMLKSGVLTATWTTRKNPDQINFSSPLVVFRKVEGDNVSTD